MNYKKIYDQLILRSKNSNRIKLESTDSNFIYYENHHVLPLCLGGRDDKTNLVLLTAKEHLIAHRLLVEIYPENESIFYSYFILVHCCNKFQIRNFKITKNEYKRISDKNILYVSMRFTGVNNPMYGKFGNKHHSFGRHHSEETKRKISKSNVGKKHSEETILKIKNIKKEYFKTHNSPMKGKKVTEEAKAKLSKSNKSAWENNDIRNKYILASKNRVKVECPHCKRFVDPSTSRRWHFDNCKIFKSNS